MFALVSNGQHKCNARSGGAVACAIIITGEKLYFRLTSITPRSSISGFASALSSCAVTRSLAIDTVAGLRATNAVMTVRTSCVQAKESLASLNIRKLVNDVGKLMKTVFQGRWEDPQTGMQKKHYMNSNSHQLLLCTWREKNTFSRKDDLTITLNDMAFISTWVY